MEKEKSDLLTPEELFRKYPQLKEIGWTPQRLGQLLACGLLDGQYSHNSGNRISLIRESSLHDVVQFRNEVVKKKIVEL